MEEQALILAKLLGIVGFQVDSRQAELIIKLNDLAEKKGDKTEIADVDLIVEEWSNKVKDAMKAEAIVGQNQ